MIAKHIKNWNPEYIKNYYVQIIRHIVQNKNIKLFWADASNKHTKINKYIKMMCIIWILRKWKLESQWDTKTHVLNG